MTAIMTPMSTPTYPSADEIYGWTPSADSWSATRNFGPVDRSVRPMPAPGTRIPSSAGSNPPANQTAGNYSVGNYSAGIDQVRYWVGAAITSVVAALVGIVGLIIAHGIVHVPVMLGSGTQLTPLHATLYGLTSAAIALGAAALYDGMLHVAPRPATYYGWLIALVTTLAVLLPFTTAAHLHSQIALAAMNLGVGLIVLILVPMAAVNARTE